MRRLDFMNETDAAHHERYVLFKNKKDHNGLDLLENYTDFSAKCQEEGIKKPQH